MAIVPLKKITLFGPIGHKRATLDSLQELGCMHLVDLQDRTTNQSLSSSVSVETHQALKFLKASPIRRRSIKQRSGFRLNEVVNNVLWIQQRQNKLKQERDELQAAIQLLRPWGDFQLPTDRELAGLHFWFYSLPHHAVKTLDDFDFPWYEAARDNQYSFVVVISSEEPKNMPVGKVDLDRRSLSTLQQRLEEVESELEELHWELGVMTRWITLIEDSIAQADDQASREQAARQTIDATKFFALQGWAPARDLKRITTLANELELALTDEMPAEDDSPPTLLENSAITRGGEAAVTFYTIPAYNAWDPSSIVFLSFSLFFAMIMADAGYALILGGLLLFFWRRLGKTDDGKSLRTLGLAIVIFSVLYGMLVGSYFGLTPPPDSFFGHLHVLDAANTNTMITLSIIIGVSHLTLANLVVAWQKRWGLPMLASLGWSVALVAGLALGFGSYGVEPTEHLTYHGRNFLIAGLLMVFLFASHRPVLGGSWLDFLWRGLDGLMALANITRAFGDVLSYLRLFALGLASAQLAATFNELTGKAASSPGVGTLLAVLVVVFGHGLNFALAIMSGVVHGLRLNCIEFFGWSLSDEGYPFAPFRRKAV